MKQPLRGKQTTLENTSSRIASEVLVHVLDLVVPRGVHLRDHGFERKPDLQTYFWRTPSIGG